MYLRHIKPAPIFFKTAFLLILCLTARGDAKPVEPFRALSFKQALQQDVKRCRDAWFGKDKLEHVTASAWLATWGFAYNHKFIGRSENRAIVYGGILAFGIGVAKEVYDWKIKRTFFSYKDLTADVFGIFIIALLVKGL